MIRNMIEEQDIIQQVDHTKKKRQNRQWNNLNCEKQDNVHRMKNTKCQ